MAEEPGYRESYPYVDSLRAKYPGRWVVLGSYSADSRQELSGGEVLVTAEDPRALSGRPGAGQPIVIIPPTVYRDQYVTFFRGDPPCRAA
ncbi:MAG: hypothetical protein Q8N51_19105, partial [Gammaproteobacteria bacterium]|nr:hypothetical protein [Gammaproteobacteria bacterium]